jgi:6-phosphogluconolactonase
MRVEVFRDENTVARRAATLLASEIRDAIAERGRCLLAVSGGRTPWRMLRLLTNEDVSWGDLHVVQVDERVAPAGDAARNLVHLRESLMTHAPLPEANLHPMPVESDDLDAAAATYAATLASLAGSPAVLDIVHLGLGGDGHTASLTPGDPVLDVADRDVAPTGVYQGHRRMTLTYPMLNRSRCILWLVVGEDKAPMLDRLLSGDKSIPAGRIARDPAILLADHGAGERFQPRN